MNCNRNGDVNLKEKEIRMESNPYPPTETKKADKCRLSSFYIKVLSLYFVITSFSVSLPDSDTALMKYTPSLSVLR